MSYPAPEQGQPYPGATEHDTTYPAGDPTMPFAGDPIATAPPAVDDHGIADFTPNRPRPMFRVGNDVFYGKLDVPTLAMMQFAAQAQKTGENDTEAEMEFSLKMLRLMLKKDSADRFIERLSSEDEDDAIGPETFQKILPYLMESYGMRPTEPSEPSVNGSPTTDGGTNSTGNSAPVA